MSLPPKEPKDSDPGYTPDGYESLSNDLDELYGSPDSGSEEDTTEET